MNPSTTPVPESPSPITPMINDLISDLRSSFFSTDFQIFTEKLLKREQKMNNYSKLEKTNDSLVKEKVMMYSEIMKLNDEIGAVRNEQLEYKDRIKVLKSEKIRVLEKLGEVEDELKKRECEIEEFKKVKCELEMKVRVYEKLFSDMEVKVSGGAAGGGAGAGVSADAGASVGADAGASVGAGAESSEQTLIIENEDSEKRTEPDFPEIILINDDDDDANVDDDDDDNNDEFDDDDDQHILPLKRKRVFNEVKIEYISDDSDLECVSTIKRNQVSEEIEKGCTTDYLDNIHSETPNIQEDVKRTEPKNLISSFNSSDSNSGEEIEKIDKSYMSLIAKLKKQKERWETEADMVKEFDKDDNLCLNAICALRRQRIIIDDYDLLRINQLALLLIDGDSQGRLKKKASELSRSDIVQCRKFAKKYSTRVFEIYQTRDDPFFPSSRRRKKGQMTRFKCLTN